MTELWLVERTDYPGYDETLGFVVIADTEGEALAYDAGYLGGAALKALYLGEARDDIRSALDEHSRACKNTDRYKKPELVLLSFLNG